MSLYTTNFILRSLSFNLALALSIVALVKMGDGYTIWATIAISFASAWLLLAITSHIIWYVMSKGERALWIAIRRHGKKIIEITDKEISKTGQKDMLEILSDADEGLEIKMLINGTGTLVNLYIGIKWVVNAHRFNKHEGEFTYHLK